MLLRPEETVDRYQIERPLGEGGMAEVYKVRHQTLHTLSALKLLKFNRPDLRERLLEEGRHQARLQHPNIVRVVDVLQIGRAPALLMEYIDGPSLSGLLQDNPSGMETGEAERLFRGILAGVAFAHQKGIIHRDLKPGNVLLETRADGKYTPKVTDFGLAKILEDSGERRFETRTGVYMGSPNYIAPEQILDAKRADHRADLFSLGAILYEMLTGELAFYGPDARAVMNSILEGRYTSLELIRPDLPPHLKAAVRTCLELDREKRVQSCAELLAVLEAPSPPSPRKWIPIEQLPPGTRIGEYTVSEKLGEGGMAVVYRVRDEKLGADRAIKLVKISGSQMRERLIQEGQLQAALNHPNIVQIYGAVELEGIPGLVMELVRGPSLDKLLASRRLNLAQADALARGILAGMIEAHHHQMVHRDLKPGNILLAPTATGPPLPKIADFGLAKITGGEGVSHTRSGMAMGTVPYMAPEQSSNAKHVDSRADIFSLGAILYELVTGRLAFPGDNPVSVWNAAAAGSYLPPRELVPDLPERINQAILGALIPDRERRIGSVSELLAAWEGRAEAADEDPRWGELLPEPSSAPSSPPKERDISSETFNLNDDPARPSPTITASVLSPPNPAAAPHAPTPAPRLPPETPPPAIQRRPRRAALYGSLTALGAMGAALFAWEIASGVPQEISLPADPPVELSPSASPEKEPRPTELAELPPEDPAPLEAAQISIEPPPASAVAAPPPPTAAPPAEQPPADTLALEVDPAPQETAPPPGPAPGMARIVVEGDADKVRFKSAAGTFTVGDLPAGTYQILFWVDGKHSAPTGTISFTSEATYSLKCRAPAGCK